ncbi:MAG: glycosyltransferase, partial [Terriglobales bacterium]
MHTKWLLCCVRTPRGGNLVLGKKAKWRRAADFASFLVVCAPRMVGPGRFDVVVCMTLPPLIAFLGALLVGMRGGRMVFWVMDLNPDEAIAAGWLNGKSAPARFLQWLLRYCFRHSQRIVALDRFMAKRIHQHGVPRSKIRILAPWSHDPVVRYDRALSG